MKTISRTRMGLHRQSAAFGLSVLAMCCFALFPVTLSAQKQSTEVVGWVIDAFTRKSIPEETQVALLEPDSTVMKVSTCDRDGRFSLMVPIQPSGAFILRFTCKGYQTAYKPIKVIWRKKKTSLSLGLITMRQLSDMADRQLGEATITATKIKFYTKNDTLVFNASAFQLQEGSMLDGLIAQLPGVEMKPDGRIFVKGRYVESLLLNGRDFFKGDNTVLLDNLPAYMVQQVQVYEKESEMSKLAGRKVDSGKYVMDVKLKRQYAIGWLANTEWGYGTENRYLGRLFAMRYTPQSRVSAFGNLNNVNSRRKPDGSGGWGDFDPSGGLTATKRAGLDYNVYDKRERFEGVGKRRCQLFRQRQRVGRHRHRLPRRRRLLREPAGQRARLQPVRLDKPHLQVQGTQEQLQPVSALQLLQERQPVRLPQRHVLHPAADGIRGPDGQPVLPELGHGGGQPDQEKRGVATTAGTRQRRRRGILGLPKDAIQL